MSQHEVGSIFGYVKGMWIRLGCSVDGSAAHEPDKTPAVWSKVSEGTLGCNMLQWFLNLTTTCIEVFSPALSPA